MDLSSYMLSPWIQAGTGTWGPGESGHGRSLTREGSRVSGPARERSGEPRKEGACWLAELELAACFHHVPATSISPTSDSNVALWISLTRPSCSVLPPSALNLLGLDSRLGRARCRVASRAPSGSYSFHRASSRACGGFDLRTLDGPRLTASFIVWLWDWAGTWQHWDCGSARLGEG